VRRRLAELRRLTPAEWRTLLVAWVLLLPAPVLLRFVPLPRLLRSHGGPRVAGLGPERVARLVQAAACCAPGARCLPVALVTAWLLDRQGTPATLRVGVARHAERLTAHAWLECGGRPLLDASESEGYTPILTVAVRPLVRSSAV
jgi:Transglutaminase-like superfamily